MYSDFIMIWKGGGGENLGDEKRFLLGSKLHPSIIQSSSQNLHYNNLVYSG